MKHITAGITVCLALLVARGGLPADEPPPGIALPPIQTAKNDERGRITVNGKPFFPILMYDVPIDPDSLKMFREHGFNTLSAPAENATTLRNYGFYTAAHAVSTEGVNLDGVLVGAVPTRRSRISALAITARTNTTCRDLVP